MQLQPQSILEHFIAPQGNPTLISSHSPSPSKPHPAIDNHQAISCLHAFPVLEIPINNIAQCVTFCERLAFLLSTMFSRFIHAVVPVLYSFVWPSNTPLHGILFTYSSAYGSNTWAATICRLSWIMPLWTIHIHIFTRAFNMFPEVTVNKVGGLGVLGLLLWKRK